MPIIQFPSSPILDDTYTVGSKTWIWNGYAWDLQTANTVAITTLAQSAYNQANNAYNQSESAYLNTLYTFAVDNTQNASISAANTLATSAFNKANNDNMMGFTSTTSPSLATTATSGTGSTATITFATQASTPYAIGSTISVTGVTPSGYNGLYQVTAGNTSSVSYASATTGAQTVSGFISQAVLLANTSSFYRYVTSTSNQSAFSLPNTSTLQQGWSFRLNNGGTASMFIYSFTGVLLATVPTGVTYYVTCIDTTVNTAAGWRVGVTEVATLTGSSGGLVLSTSPTIAGTLNFTGSGTSAAQFATAVTTALTTVGSTTGTGSISIGRSTASQPILIGSGVTTASTTANGASSSIAGTVLTVAGANTGTFSIGMSLSGTNVLPSTYITSLGTGTGGLGTYNINQTQTVASTTITGRTQKSIDIGTNGGNNSITAITLGSSNTGATSTTTINGTLNVTGIIRPKVNSAATVTSPLAWNSTSFDQYALTGLANTLTISADANAAPADGQRMLFRIKDNGTARALTWTTGSTNSFRVIGTTLPTTTVISKLVYVGCIYNAADSRWDVLAVGQEA
jgi:hypothetical protein